MIKYDRLWETMKKRGITQYDLYEHYNFSRSFLDRLRKNQNIELYTLDRLCDILDCDFCDLVEHVQGDPKEPEKSKPDPSQ